MENAFVSIACIAGYCDVVVYFLFYRSADDADCRCNYFGRNNRLCD